MSTEHYIYADKKDTGLYFVHVARRGGFLWAVSTVRKKHVCSVTGDDIAPGESAYALLNRNGRNRMDRISEKGMRILVANREMYDE